jgi:hypothetical protein
MRVGWALIVCMSSAVKGWLVFFLASDKLFACDDGDHSREGWTSAPCAAGEFMMRS